MKSINESIICAGFGGQGVMTLGKVLTYAGMDTGLHVTYFPSYGAEVRGGTAHSIVRLSSESIANPLVSYADTIIAMNGPSLEKFEERVSSGGLFIINSSLAGRSAARNDIDVVEAPLTDEAIKLGNVRVANIVAAGIFLKKKNIYSRDLIVEVIKKMAGASHLEKLVPVNIKALERGMELAG